MNINRMSLKNFMNFEQMDFQLNRSFNIIIGINGKGKSTLLHAIRIACGAYLLGIPEANKRHIWPSEIRRKDFGTHLSMQTPTIVEAEGSVDDQLLSKPWRRVVPEGKTKTSASQEDISEIHNIAKKNMI